MWLVESVVGGGVVCSAGKLGWHEMALVLKGRISSVFNVGVGSILEKQFSNSPSVFLGHFLPYTVLNRTFFLLDPPLSVRLARPLSPLPPRSIPRCRVPQRDRAVDRFPSPVPAGLPGLCDRVCPGGRPAISPFPALRAVRPFVRGILYFCADFP